MGSVAAGPTCTCHLASHTLLTSGTKDSSGFILADCWSSSCFTCEPSPSRPPPSASSLAPSPPFPRIASTCSRRMHRLPTPTCAASSILHTHLVISPSAPPSDSYLGILLFARIVSRILPSLLHRPHDGLEEQGIWALQRKRIVFGQRFLRFLLYGLQCKYDTLTLTRQAELHPSLPLVSDPLKLVKSALSAQRIAKRNARITAQTPVHFSDPRRSRQGNPEVAPCRPPSLA